MKGIRDYVNERFAKLLPELATLGNAGFRGKVMEEAVKKFGISVASAATHYNHSLKIAKLHTPDLVEGLGRPEDKKGGRKKKAVTTTPAAASTDAGATGDVVNSNILGNAGEQTETPAATISTAAALTGLENLGTENSVESPEGGLLQNLPHDEQTNWPEATGQEEVTPVPDLPQEPEAPVQKYSVKKVADGTIVCEGLTLEEANELIEKAKAAKKGKLELVTQ